MLTHKQIFKKIFKKKSLLLLKSTVTRLILKFSQTSEYESYGMYYFGIDTIEGCQLSKSKNSVPHWICLNYDRMSYHTHPSQNELKRKYMPPSGGDLMSTFHESFVKKMPTYSLVVDKNGFYFYRPSTELWIEIWDDIKGKKASWKKDIFDSFYFNEDYTELVNTKQTEWNDYFCKLDIEMESKNNTEIKNEMKKINKCLQAHYNSMGFDIYFIPHDGKYCFDIIAEKIIAE